MKRTYVAQVARTALSFVIALVAASCPAWAEQQFDSKTLRVGLPTSDALLEAIEQVKELRSSGVEHPITIEIPAGRYAFQSTLRLGPEVVGQGLTLKAAISPKAKPKEQVIFSGGIKLEATGREGRGNWRYKLPPHWDATGRPRCLIIDRKLRRAARHPNSGYLRIDRVMADRRSGFIVGEGDLPSGLDLTAGPSDMVLLHDWSSSQLSVASWNAEARELRTAGPIGCAANHYAIDHFEKHPRYFLEGHSSFADLPGEWTIDLAKGEIVVVADEAETSAPSVVLPNLAEILVASGSDVLPLERFVIEGITFMATRYPIPVGGLTASQATQHERRAGDGQRLKRQLSMLPAALTICQATECRVVSCSFNRLGGTGLWFGQQTRRCQVSNCRVEHVGGNGINMGEDQNRRVGKRIWYQAAPDQVPTDNRVEACEVSFCGEMMPGSIGIWAALQKRLVIDNCFIHDTPYTGISLGWIWNPSPTPAGENRIQNNRIEFVMQTLSDGGGIYTLGRQPDSIIQGNTICDVPLNAGSSESNGMFLDEGTTGFTILDNTIRRVARSPLRFHKATTNIVSGNRWELATEKTQPVRYNKTKEEAITLSDNEVVKRQKQIYLIGNSLTWDTCPPQLDERVLWHIDCGKSLGYMAEHPKSPCITSSRIWPIALRTTQFDIFCFQPYGGNGLEEDVATIARWIEMQPRASIVVHTGWAPFAKHQQEWSDSDAAGPPTHSEAYINALLERLRAMYPKRTIVSSQAMHVLQRIREDIEAGEAPFASIEQLFRDPTHMELATGRYLMHNVLRRALGQPHRNAGFPPAAPDVKAYLDSILARDELFRE